jgi:hypothetical protein
MELWIRSQDRELLAKSLGVCVYEMPINFNKKT